MYQFIYDSNSKPVLIVGKAINVNKQRILEDQVKLDSLTQCYSKIYIEETITKLLENECYQNGAILFVDINSFNKFNEQYGHFYGDELLRQLVSRIKRWCNSDEVIGRIGADEFVLFIPDTQNISHFENRLDLLVNEINSQYVIDKNSVKICAGVGVTLCSDITIPYIQYAARAKSASSVAKLTSSCKWTYYDHSHINSPSIASVQNTAEKITGLNINHTITSSIFNILYERDSDDVAITSALRYLVQSYGSSRCYIAESFDNGDNFDLTYEWCKPTIPSARTAQSDYPSEYIKQLLNTSTTNDMYACPDVANCKDATNIPLPNIIASIHAKSFLHAQVRKDDVVTFFIGIEDCDKTRNWSEKEINTLHYLSRIFSLILQKKSLFQENKILSRYNKISAFVGDNTDNFIYIVDPDTFEIIHMNKKALQMYNNPPEHIWRNMKCYELLHEKTQPCEFCTNAYTTEDNFYEWKYYSPRFNKMYLYKDKLVHLNGKLVKLQVATDITRIATLEDELTNKIEEQELLLNCIRMLHTSDAPDDSINHILDIVCTFFQSSRGVIIQFAQDGQTISNTHEWTDSSFTSGKHLIQNLPSDIIHPLLRNFGTSHTSYIDNVNETFKNDMGFLEMMQSRNVNSVIVSPIIDNTGKLIGFFGLDNPKKYVDKHWLLGSLSVFISDFLRKNRLISSLNRLSYYDTLTGVKNRHSYTNEINNIGNLSSLGVAYIDISKLSKINEEKGTKYGDGIIKKMSFILLDIFGKNVFRVGGDEFVVLDKNVAELIFEDKINLLKNAIFEEPELNASIGFTWNDNSSTIEDNESDPESLTSSYSSLLSKNLENEIRSGKYIVYLQAQINMQTNKLDGAEALIRRIDARGNIQSPISFVPFYEKEGMISQIDLYVFTTVCKLLAKWKNEGVGVDMKVSVNFSRSTIMGKNIVNQISEICDRYNVERSLFVVEITETISHSDDNLFSLIISSLKNSGFCVSLDDFGSGHSNLSALKISDFDEIKIDMGLTKDVHIDEKSRILTKVALNLCNEFDYMISVAEGIETIEQFNVLKELKCKKGQGYYFSKPVTIDDFEKKYFNKVF